MNVVSLYGSSAVSLFGIFSNFANIIVFYKMGLDESINVSFFSLAINHLIACMSTLVAVITLSPKRRTTLQPEALTLQTGFLAIFLNSSCSGLGAWITAVLSIERCLCIRFPLKVSIGNVCKLNQ